MRLVSVRVENFRSIDDSGEVVVDPRVTVLVGQNESGKTGFLQALHLCRSVQNIGGFELDRDYPRKAVNEYRARHETKPDPVATLHYELTPPEVEAINGYLGLPLLTELRVSTTHHFKNGYTVGIRIEEAPYVRHLIERSSLSADVRAECVAAPSLRAVIKLLGEKDLNADGKEFLAALTTRFKPADNKWASLLEYEVWTKFLKPALPKFFYFDDYFLLPGKVNLRTLLDRVTNTSLQTEEDRTVLSLLELAEVNLQDLTSPQGYEQIKSRLEGLQNSITDRIIEFWTQNPELEVEFDIREDPQDRPPFNQGANLYLRIKNRRHRVTVPFSQRSKGFIWFFSFIVRFDTIKRQLNAGDQLVLLLDEPGHSLHAVAQRDFLRYMDALSERHQILYTTHSPYMIRGERLEQVRVVEDREGEGTVVSPDLAGAAPNTLVPLQAALGYSVAEKLLRARRNLLVGGPVELVYLNFFSTAIERAGRVGLRDDLSIVPAGGLDRLVTLIALLGTGTTELVILHDWPGPSGSQADEFTERRLVKPKFVLNYGQFRDLRAKGKAVPAPATDLEDLISVSLYLKLFNGTFADELTKEVKESDLPAGDRIVERLTTYLSENAVLLRSKGGFDRYAVANYLVSNPPKAIDKDTLARFEELSKKVNGLFTPTE